MSVRILLVKQLFFCMNMGMHRLHILPVVLCRYIYISVMFPIHLAVSAKCHVQISCCVYAL